MQKRTFLFLVPLLFGALPAFGEEAETAALRFYPYENGLGAAGFDVVAYFKEGAAAAGSADYEAEFGGAVWRFKSAENRAEFVAAPEQYLPRYGGYCAYAAALDALAYGDPQNWSIKDGVLYFNYNAPTRETWLEKAGQYIRQSEKNWPALSRRE